MLRRAFLRSILCFALGIPPHSHHFRMSFRCARPLREEESAPLQLSESHDCDDHLQIYKSVILSEARWSKAIERKSKDPEDAGGVIADLGFLSKHCSQSSIRRLPITRSQILRASRSFQTLRHHNFIHSRFESIQSIPSLLKICPRRNKKARRTFLWGGAFPCFKRSFKGTSDS